MYQNINAQIGQFTKYLHLGQVTIDTLIFKLHYVARFVCILLYFLLLNIFCLQRNDLHCV